jgi:hypothetical protein
MTEPHDSDALQQALRAPGSAEELREEETYVALFRAAQSSPSPAPLAPGRRRAVSRFGAGTAFVLALAVGGSAAAAYTNHLPEPIQRFAHRALGPVAPPPPHPRHHARDHEVAAPTPSATPSPTEPAPPTPTAEPTRSPAASPSHLASHLASHPPRPTPTPTPTPTPAPSSPPSATPAPTPTPTPTAAPTGTPTPTLVPVVAASLSIAGSTHKVEPDQSVAFSGVVTSAAGDPVRRARVALQTWSGGWTTVATARSDSSGSVSLLLPPVTATTAARLRTTNGVHSSRWRVSLHPELSVTSTLSADRSSVTIEVTASGAQAGDPVQLMSAGRQVAGDTLTEGAASFTVTPTAKRTRYVVVLPGTAAHGPDRASITVIVKKPRGGGPAGP